MGAKSEEDSRSKGSQSPPVWRPVVGLNAHSKASLDVGIGSQLFHMLALWPSPSYLTSETQPCIYQMGWILGVPVSVGCSEEKVD